ncbi:hypothetical protein ElyMa_000185200 [Elysia marginata]|uniref:PiggyBac transposable element-derived protein 4 C-terminal zinc-finger domain-containing protein n=1 Tax=Elysia marginata TaxID=1093978 RepID=A0AAV4EWC7_9GAST|nr:hypothetical protein ElyMa_000185200 [Elysia marginata]
MSDVSSKKVSESKSPQLSQVPQVSTCKYQASSSSDVQAKILSFKTSSEASVQSVSVQFHDYCGYVNPESCDKVHVTEMCQTSMSTVEIQTQTPHILMADAQTQTNNSDCLKAADIIDNDGLEDLIDELLVIAAKLMPGELRDAPAHSRGRPSLGNPIERLLGNRHLIHWTGMDRNCLFCSTPEQRKRTFTCEGCSGEPYLCAKHCFERYHSAE